MTKLKFLLSLRDRLPDLPPEDVEERLGFYSEMIEDRMEEGLSEEEAVAAVGSVDEIAAQIISETSLPPKKAKAKRQLRVWEIVLLALGSPIWLSLLVAAFAVIVSIFAAVWAVIICLWAVFASLVACAFAGVVSGIILTFVSHALAGVAMIAAGLICAGLSIFLFYGCKAATVGTVWLAKTAVSSIRKEKNV